MMSTTTLEILSEIDALHLPARDVHPGIPAWAGIHEARKAFRTNGLPWSTGGGTEQARKASQRELAELEQEGRILVIRGAGKAVGVKLAEGEEEALRRAACLDTYGSALLLLDDLHDLLEAGRGHEVAGQRWIRETSLANALYGIPIVDLTGKDLAALEEAAAILAGRGLMDSRTDCQRRAWYSLTPAGIIFAKERAQHRTCPDGLHAPDANTRAAYLKMLTKVTNRLQHLQPSESREIGPLPIPVGVSD